MEASKEEKTAVSNRDRAQAKQELLDTLLEGCSSEEDLFGPEGVFTKLKGAVMQRLLEAEMSEHLGHEPQGRRRSRNARNGHSPKTVQTETGPVEIQVPRDREGTFEPQLVKKHQRRLEGFDEKVIALYARGMTTRDIQQHLRELYGTDVSHELISRATDGVLDEFRAWQTRPLEPVYPVVYLDALFVSVRDGGQVAKRAFYVALGVRVDGTRDVLGLWVAGSEGSKFWLSILTELKNRGVDDILFVCADGLSGLGQAIEAAFPKAVHQTCVVHLIRSALRFVSWSDRKRVSAVLRPIYNAENEQAAELALDEASRQLDARCPSVVRTFRNRWTEFVPFLSYPAELRRMLYTTNAVESLNSQLRKTLRQRGPFPNDEAVFKLLFLAIQNAKVHWRRPIAWTRMLVQLDIFLKDVCPPDVNLHRNSDTPGDNANEMGDSLAAVPLGTPATAIATGGAYSCALLSNGSVKCWGDNTYGQLGQGNSTAQGDQAGEIASLLPINLGTGLTAIAITAGSIHACALLNTNEVKCWGGNEYGQLGLGHANHMGDGAGEMGNALAVAYLGTGGSVVSVYSGRRHTCAQLSNNTLKCWGLNAFGQLGLGNTANRGDQSNEMGDFLAAVSLGSGASAINVALGFDHSCAVLNNGQAKCWGQNNLGQLGLGNTLHKGDGAGEMGDALALVDVGPEN